MSMFNNYLNSHFSGCQLIARAKDDCRNREVTIYRIPGHWDVVGVSDGTDAWIAPTSTGPFFRTATGDVTKIMRALEAGDPLPPVPSLPGRRRVRLLDEPDPSPPPRTRASLKPADQAQPAGRRRALLS